MYRLDNFYYCKPWRNLLEQLKIERVNDEGEIICEYCNKPIAKKYDIIGHHKIELTDDNVNDFNISLNPDNVMLVHGKCHNFIHNKLGHKVRQIFIVYGPPLAGKSTYVKGVRDEGDLVIDLDNIWQAISDCDRYVKPGRLKPIVFKLRDTLLDSVKYRLGTWNNCYIIGGYPLISERERLLKELGAREVFIDVPKEECLARLQGADGRDIEAWTKYINEWFDKFTASY